MALLFERRDDEGAGLVRLTYLDTMLSVGSIARVRTNIQATTTAQVNAMAPDETTTLRKSGTASTTLRDKATANSDHSGQFFIADDNRFHPCSCGSQDARSSFFMKNKIIKHLHAEVEAESARIFAELQRLICILYLA